ncbi:MAG TPA: hypothetical protein ENK86_01525 [Campylobacterales bacterium]|nr:hypothetical protein [Campylobacterales bacterium]
MYSNRYFLSFISSLVLSVTACAEPPSPFDSMSVSKAKETNTPFQQVASSESNQTTADDHANALAQKLQTEINKKNSPILHTVHDKSFLKRFYRQNSYQPLWIEASDFGGKAQSLLRAVENDPTIIAKSKIHDEYLFLHKYLKSKQRNQDALSIELRLSQLYLDVLEHTLYGKIDWKDFQRKLKAEKRKRISGNWVPVKASYKLSELMLKPNIQETLNAIKPKNFGYESLLTALQKLRELQAKGGWEKLPEFKKLTLGDQGDNVIKLRDRLKASGDLGQCEQTGEKLFESTPTTEAPITFQPEAIFDECLDAAVRKFQKRHGLEEDGIVGKGTQRAMNESVESKIQKVLLNIDRIKWLPRELGDRYLVVNIPEFMLHYIVDGKTQDQIRVIVGDKKHRTPIFNEKVSFIVLNPYWKVPMGIVKREIIPAMVRNPRYLAKEGLEIHTTWSENSPKIDPSWLFWEDYYHGYEKFPYRIMQPPGKRNALGKIKFKFPNRFDVYLHDTPTKHLFKRTARAFSHGCIRVSEPYELFKKFSTFNDNINLKKADKILKGKRQRQINIQNKLPIHIVYLTAGYDAQTEELQFREDVYRYDTLQNVDKY